MECVSALQHPDIILRFVVVETNEALQRTRSAPARRESVTVRTRSVQFDEILPSFSCCSNCVALITSKPDFSISSLEAVGGFT